MVLGTQLYFGWISSQGSKLQTQKSERSDLIWSESDLLRFEICIIFVLKPV